MSSVLDPILRRIAGSVRRSAGSAGGTCSWPFTQMYGTVSTLIGSEEVTRDGICEMLAAAYIERLNSGSHLRTYLAGGEGAIDESKIRQLMQLFMIGETMHPNSMIGLDSYQQDSTDQTRATVVWLEAKGLSHQNSEKAERTGGHASFGQMLGNTLVRMGPKYATIGIWGPKGGHSMSATVAGQMRFFDPNFGEFSFGSSKSFARWFAGFWRKFYGRAHLGANLSDKYHIMSYS
ncbi:MAG: YopT-type cysteine protease domain-containing protein [Longimicrobiales bacterium]